MRTYRSKAAVLSLGVTVTAVLAGSAGSQASGFAGPHAQAPVMTCSKTATGRLAACPRPLTSRPIPVGASNESVLTSPVKNLAGLVDTRTWTSGGGNTFPGADVPFGMVQWSPDTMPDRSDGGGYTYGDKLLTGYSLTHLSGPGCPAAGDVPILPMTGSLPAGDPSTLTTSFTNAGEVAQAGYYSAVSNGPGADAIESDFTATKHSAVGRFTFPRTTQADFLIKLDDSDFKDFGTSVHVIGDDEVAGSVTSGDFCWQTNAYGPQQYTVYFDIIFSEPFTADQIVTEPGQADPNSVFLTFDTTSNPVIKAHAAISYVSVANARLDRRTEAPGWDFSRMRTAAQTTWNKLLGKISVAGGRFGKTQQFYSLLYKSLLQPNVISDVNRQYLGSDFRVHLVTKGHSSQYGTFSGWDIYHSLAQLQAMLDPSATSDMAQSLVNFYAQNHILPQWGYINLDTYAMIGDPADAIIADYYAFGTRHFDESGALADMLTQATTVNTIRPGEALEARYGYLPVDGVYGCCNFRWSASALLEYDNADFALSAFAADMHNKAAAARFARRANNWVNLFDRSTGLLAPRYQNGKFVADVTATTTDNYAEGDAYEYLWDVPDDYAGLFAKLGGDSKVLPMLRRYLAKPDGLGKNADLLNEFGDGEQFAPDYAKEPSVTQRVVNSIRTSLYRPGPFGIGNNEDLGAESSQFIWEMLGMYPENPGTGTLVFASPGFPYMAVHLSGGKTIAIHAPGASPSRFYVRSLTINGKPHAKLYVPFATLARGAKLNWILAKAPTTWGSAAKDAPPSYRSGD
ncbi:MAG TPA: GH92 family glycosyl hydrolase [Streptosporangiaceae bacterium]|nr:GH92 family glycosyl hydrolase [Streptosporangiaceae bacterium]